MKAIAAAALVSLLVGAPAKRVDVHQWSYGLAAGGGSVWVGGLSVGDVVRVDARTGKVLGEVQVGPRVFNLAAAPGAVWAVSNSGGSVTRIDTRTGKAGKPIRVGLQPYDVEWGFGSAWVSNAGGGTVSRITGSRVVKTIRTGYEPNGLTAYGGSLWVSDHTGGKVFRVDPRTNRVTGSVAVAGADWITGWHGALYVSQETNRVARVDPRTLKVTGSVKVAKNPLGSAIVGGKLWVPCIDANQVDVVDPVTMKLVARRAGGPSPIVVLPAFGHVWLSHTFDNRVWRF